MFNPDTMSRFGGLAIVGVFMALLVGLFALVGIVAYVSNANYGNKAEKELVAKLEDNKNILGQYTLKIQEMAQIPEMYKNDLREIVQASFEGRYGEKGSQATWQWIQEQNPNLDPALYNRIQQTMEAGRNEFKTAQTELLDKKRAYETNLGYLWKGFWLGLAGYPKIDLTKIRIVVASDTQEKFDTGVDHGIKLDTGKKPEPAQVE